MCRGEHRPDDVARMDFSGLPAFLSGPCGPDRLLQDALHVCNNYSGDPVSRCAADWDDAWRSTYPSQVAGSWSLVLRLVLGEAVELGRNPLMPSRCFVSTISRTASRFFPAQLHYPLWHGLFRHLDHSVLSI